MIDRVVIPSPFSLFSPSDHIINGLFTALFKMDLQDGLL